MTIMFGAFLGGWEIVLILAVVLILFGAKKLPELAKGLGQGIKEFKKASREVTDELQNVMEDDHYSTSPPKDRKVEPAQKSLPQSSESTVPHSTEHKA